MKTKTKQYFFVAAIAVMVLAVAVILIVWAVGRGHDEPMAEPAALPALSEPEIQVVYKEKEVEKLVEVEKVISGDIIEDGLNDMGFLVTQEYWFTEVMSYSSTKNLFGIQLGITESSFLASYDGKVTAGVDFSKIKVEKNDELQRITVKMPAAELLDTTIDTDSFTLYDEKEGIGNNISIKDYNVSLTTLKQGATDKAVERGVLDKAQENAEQMIRDFVSSLVDTTMYEITLMEV